MSAQRPGRWSEADIPDQTGRTVLVTGANSGVGLSTAEVLAGKGAKLLLACRSPERGRQALATVGAVATGPAPELVLLDLADLESVAEAAAAARELTGDSLDVLVNNAGVMAIPQATTKDGFETQFGTNHLGHAALTWLLMPALRGGTAARVVTLSSVAATVGRLDLVDPNFTGRRYHPVTAYAQSKLANQVFALELDRRLRAAGDEVISVAAHPGYPSTDLGANMARNYRAPLAKVAIGGLHKLGALLIAQSARQGALPQLYAATAPDVEGGDYFGPRGPGNLWGAPTKVRPVGPARNEGYGAALWDLTAKLTSVTPDPA
jgi:NAD(P)-dependent dehydrogenase (short-subunit alcohol dehydrogenase family)